MKWISVKDRLPEYRQDVLTYGPHGIVWGFRVHVMSWRTIEFVSWDDERERMITHWMPRPENPPKDE